MSPAGAVEAASWASAEGILKREQGRGGEGRGDCVDCVGRAREKAVSTAFLVDPFATRGKVVVVGSAES